MFKVINPLVVKIKKHWGVKKSEHQLLYLNLLNTSMVTIKKPLRS